MPIMPLLLLFAVSAAPDPAAAQEPLLVAHADGTWAITRAIHEEPAPLADATGGLVVDEEDYRFARDDAVSEAEARADRAFEDEVDKAKATAAGPD